MASIPSSVCEKVDRNLGKEPVPKENDKLFFSLSRILPFFFFFVSSFDPLAPSFPHQLGKELTATLYIRITTFLSSRFLNPDFFIHFSQTDDGVDAETFFARFSEESLLHFRESTAENMFVSNSTVKCSSSCPLDKSTGCIMIGPSNGPNVCDRSQCM